MLNLVCCFSSLLLSLLVIGGIIGLIIWLTTRNKRKKIGSEGEEYFKQVLQDLRTLRPQLDSDSTTFQQIYHFFENKLKGIEKVSKRKGLVVKKEEVKAKSQKEEKESSLQLVRRFIITEFSTSLLLYLGAFLVISAALILIVFNWEQFSNVVKALILPLFIFGFALTGFVFCRFKKIRSAGITFLVISEILFPLAFISIWRFLLIDTQLLNFWSYWLIVSIGYLIFTIVYNHFLKNYVTKILVIFGLNSLIVSMALAGEFDVVPSIIFMLSQNLVILMVYRFIKDTFLRRSVFVVSQIFNALLAAYTYLFFLIELIEGSLLTDNKALPDTLSSRLLSFSVLFIPVIFMLISYIKTKRWLFYLILLPFTLFGILYFGLIWSVRIEYILIVLCIFIFIFLLCEEAFKVLKRRVEQIYSYVFSILLPGFILLVISAYDIWGDVSDTWIYIFSGIIILYLLVRYVWNKFYLYLGFASFISLYPVLKYIFSIDIAPDYLTSIIIYSVSLAYLGGSVLLKYLKVKRSAFALLPAFYLLNFLGIFALLAECPESKVVGLFFVLNTLVYLLKSLFLYKGKITQLCIVWELGAIALIFGNDYSRIQLAWIYILFASISYIITEFVRLYANMWKSWAKIGIVNFIENWEITSYIFSIISYAIAIVIALDSISLGSVLVFNFLLLFCLFLAYRSRDKRWFLLIFTFLFIWVVKCINYFDIPREYIGLFFLITGCVSYLLGLLHKQIPVISNRYKKFYKIYLNIGLFYILVVYIFALLDILRLPSCDLYIQILYMAVVICMIAIHGLKEKNIVLNIIPAYFSVFLLWRIWLHYDLDNSQYYFIPLGLAFHLTSLILNSQGNISKTTLFLDKVKVWLKETSVFDVLGILTILGVSLVQSIDNGFYLILLIFEGALYAILWPYLGKRSLAILSLVIVGVGVILKVFNLILTFPQWLVLGIAGLVILAVAVVFLLVRRDK